jgi:hypothetical protein
MLTIRAALRGTHSLCALRIDLNVDGHRLADAGDGFGSGSKHQIEVAPRDWIGRNRPARSSSVINRGQQFYVQRDRSGHAVHCYVAKDIATLRTSLLYAAAFERDMGEFLRAKKLCAAEMIVTLFNPRIDAADVDLRRDRRVLRMFPINFNLAAEVRELAAGRTEELVHAEADSGSGRIELVRVLTRCGRAERDNHQRCDKIAYKPVHNVILGETRLYLNGRSPRGQDFNL